MQSPHCALVAYKVAQFSNNDAGERGLHFHCGLAEHGELYGDEHRPTALLLHQQTLSQFTLCLDQVPGSPLSLFTYCSQKSVCVCVCS